ncbi:MAG: hypothetical protein GWN00_21620 [Aliifodinibius sp.]|nr:hypothetical protein [Fodinibius sp.]NIV13549.1 hypothetical protein [Fodinibius sp.]NIY27306.1 hypothetical protein [Fodinibius sp.]
MAIFQNHNLAEHFGYKGMGILCEYLSTQNCESQALAIHGSNAENILSTGTKLAFINGNPYALAADTELDISGDTEGTETAWATATSYSVGDVVENRDGTRYICHTAHTSSADDSPGFSDNFVAYWEEAPNAAENAVGATVASGSSRWFLVTAKSDGTLTVWLAGDAATDGSEVLKIPQFCPKTYVAIGLIHVNSNTSFVMGTTALTTIGTFYQITGSVFPHPDNIDKN